MNSKQLDPIGGTVSDAGIAAVFPTPIYIKQYAITDQELDPIRTLIKSNLTSNKKDFYGAMSSNSYLLNDESCKDLRIKLKNYLQEYTYCYLGFQGEFEFLQSWVSVKQPGQEHHPHSHANSIVSGVIYFDNLDDCEPITFIRPGTNSNLAQYSMVPSRNEINNEFTYTQVSFDVKNLMLILFPSYLMHFVGANKSQVNRYSMAFNAIPKYSLGLANDLTELNFSQHRKD